MKSRVLQLCLSPSAGGLELMAIRFAKLLQSQGVYSPLVGIEKSFISERIQNTSELHDPSLFLPHKQNILGRARALAKITDEHNITHIIVHRFKDLKAVALLKNKRPQIKVIAWSHIFIDYRKKDLVHKLLYSCIDQVVCMTETHKNNLKNSLPITEQKMKVIPLGIDLKRFAVEAKSEEQKQFRKMMRTQLGCNESTFLIGTAGRFDPQKGQTELIEAIRLLKECIETQENPIIEDFKLVLVGEDTQGEPGTKAECERLIEKYGLHDHVHIVGFMENIQNFYRALDVFVMPSYQETFGLVLVEAMASGCICLSTNAGGPIDILNKGELGLLVEPKSEVALFKGIKSIAQNRPHWKQRAELAKKKALSEYNEERLVENLLELIQ